MHTSERAGIKPARVVKSVATIKSHCGRRAGYRNKDQRMRQPSPQKTLTHRRKLTSKQDMRRRVQEIKTVVTEQMFDILEEGARRGV